MPCKLILDRIFDRDDLVFFVSDFVERRIERRRLTGTGRPGYQHHAVRLSNVTAKLSADRLRQIRLHQDSGS